jgi:hypothetical protein
MASKTKIYIVMEYATGGELFDKIVSLFFLKSHMELLVRFFNFFSLAKIELVFRTKRDVHSTEQNPK